MRTQSESRVSGITLTASLSRITSIYRYSTSVRLFLVEEHRNHLFIASHSAQSPLSSSICAARKRSTLAKTLTPFGTSLVCPQGRFSDTGVFHRIHLRGHEPSPCLSKFCTRTSQRDFNALRDVPTKILSTSSGIESFFLRDTCVTCFQSSLCGSPLTLSKKQIHIS